MKESIERDHEEDQMTLVLMETIEKKIERSESLMKNLMESKVKKLHDLNNDYMERRFIVNEKNQTEWNSLIENFHLDQIAL